MPAIIIADNPNPLFDLALGTAFEMTLKRDIAPTFANMQSGVKYYLSFQQDATGNHGITWPANIVNPSAPDQTPGSVTVMSFLARSNDNLYPTAPATFN